MGRVDVLDQEAFLDSTRWTRCCAKNFAHILLVNSHNKLFILQMSS